MAGTDLSFMVPSGNWMTSVIEVMTFNPVPSGVYIPSIYYPTF